MQNRGLTPNAVTLLCCLQACGNTRALCRGKQMHVDIINKGMLREHCLLGNALVDMYAKCGAFEKAERVSNEQLIRNRVTWTALIAGYCEHGEHDKAILCHQRMQSEGLSSDGLTLAWVLKACSSIRDLERGKEVHVTIAREGFLKRDNVLANALVDMYAKCGAPEMAEQVFEELPMCDGVVSWTAVITGYHQQGQGEEALSCFKRMQMKGFSPDIVTLLCTLQVCGSLGAIQNGEQIHASVVRQGLLGNDKLGNVLVDMYSKCGKVFKAQLVFDDLGIQDVVSWTALMAGHALTGKHDEVFGLLNRMMRLGISPNSVTLTVVLSACTDVCLLNKAPTLFEMMNLRYGVSPAVEHCTCIVDLLGRAGRFDEAVNIAEGMTSVKNLPVWLALLATCRQWDNVEIGEFAFEHILHSN
ncbi:hypothetical protein KP509_14G073700 [Ceratopteris richardii]|nr:hypothetical protein KP509_14G073700 [Ceratopteris richardii]